MKLRTGPINKMFNYLSGTATVSTSRAHSQKCMSDIGGHQVDARTVIDSVSRFQKLPSALGACDIEISSPWHFNESGKERIPFEHHAGIYLYTRPGGTEWRVPLGENTNEVWYVGKSAGSLGGRIWSHMGSIYDPETGTPWEPRFKRHRWAELQAVPLDVRESVANGDVVVYTMAIQSEANLYLMAELLEKHVLVDYVLANGRLPVLNMQL